MTVYLVMHRVIMNAMLVLKDLHLQIIHAKTVVIFRLSVTYALIMEL